MAEPIPSVNHHRQPPPDKSTTAADTNQPILSNEELFDFDIDLPVDQMLLSSNSTEENFDFDLPEDIDLTVFDDLGSCLLPENEQFSFHNSDNSASPEPGSSDRVPKYLNCSPSEAMNAASPDSGANAVFVDPKIKIGDVDARKSRLQKRKEGTAGELGADENNSRSNCFIGVDEEDEKGKVRLVRNREYAHLSRQRKKHHVEELKDTARRMSSTIAILNGNLSFLMAEHANLRQQCIGNGMGNPPMAPMPYPCVVQPQRSQVPLVPIPRSETASASRPKKPEPKKAEGKSKKGC